MKHFYLLLMAVLYTLTASSQTAPPWDFNNTDENFTAHNGASLSVGATNAILSTTSTANRPEMRNADPMIIPSVQGNLIVLTLQNQTRRNRLQVITNNQTAGIDAKFTNVDISIEDTDFKTYQIDMSGNAGWSDPVFDVDGVTPLSGVHDITFRFNFNNGLTQLDADILVDNIEIQNTLSIEDRSAFDFKLYPNPVKNILNINSKEVLASITAYDMLGRTVLEFKKPAQSIDVSSLNRGVYILKLEAVDGGLATKRFVKE